MINKIEVLSPAGSWESLKAAAAAGADAVYFGGSSFNARKNAENFNDQDIENVVSFCHARGIKVFFTLNTIIFDNEMEKALNLASLVCKAGIDAIILQDLGLASLIKRAAPDVRLHASTQMSVHNIAGVRKLAELGFKRVVLSRELSEKEIEVIAENSPVELEVFVHGALCMSVSGQCYMSAFFGGDRSGNRGLCAQPCRLPFSIGHSDNVLSLKDLSIINNIQKLSNSGVFSAKIEGRMKRPEYVYAATSACKKAAEGYKISAAEQQELVAVFSRNGFTKGYFDSRIDKDMFGIRRYEDVKSSEESLKRIRSLYQNAEKQCVKVNFDLSITKNGVRLTAADCNSNSVTVEGKNPEKAKNHAIDEKTSKEKLSKTGGTPFFTGEINVSVEDCLAVPVSEINSLRRESLQLLLEKRGRVNSLFFDNSVIDEVKHIKFSTENKKSVEKIRLRFRSLDQIPKNLDFSDVEMIVLPLKETADKKIASLIEKHIIVAAEMPRAIFSNEKKISDLLISAKKFGVNDAVCGNVGAINIAEKVNFTIHGDFGLNISNSASLEAYADAGLKTGILSFETPFKGIKQISARGIIPCGIIVYGRLPLMLVRNCPVRSFKGCIGECFIKDRTNCEFPLVCENGASEILNSRPLWLCDKKSRILNSGVELFELYFTIESAAQVENVLERWYKGLACKSEFTRGLYFH